MPDLEGTEAADWLNEHGVTAFVVSYRTTDDRSVPGWIEPLQDAQRMLSLVRSRLNSGIFSRTALDWWRFLPEARWGRGC